MSESLPACRKTGSRRFPPRARTPPSATTVRDTPRGVRSRTGTRYSRGAKRTAAVSGAASAAAASAGDAAPADWRRASRRRGPRSRRTPQPGRHGWRPEAFGVPAPRSSGAEAPQSFPRRGTSLKTKPQAEVTAGPEAANKASRRRPAAFSGKRGYMAGQHSIKNNRNIY